ncbi:MAG: T9SS type A sorting domain-containing protein [Taibaiella sp.]|nr:T9SS type A sorting domain-containing protein [Taibaiella sp.]
MKVNFNKKCFTTLIGIIVAMISNAQVYTFTTGGATGINGPTQAQINAAYSATNLAGSVTATAGIQNWTVPVTGLYKIEVIGANGYGVYGGKGAYMSGEFVLNAADPLKILVGQQGGCCVGSGTNQYGGGGGSFVVAAANTPLIIAGGGGGAATFYTAGVNLATAHNPIADATITITANNASGTTSGAGGTAGNGGNEGSGGGGGGGFLTNANSQYGGLSFLNGGTGGTTTGSGGWGGFGGGGGCNSWNNMRGGGGGGYSGGGGAGSSTSVVQIGGGGASFNSGSNQINTPALGTGDGKVIITLLTPSSTVPNNTGITALPSLNGALSCTGPQTVTARIRNFGSNAVDSVKVGWEVNGVAQTASWHHINIDTFPVQPYDTVVVLGVYNFGTGPHTVRAWTSLPNNQADTVNTNDTTSVTITPVSFTLNTSQDTICANATANLTVSPGTGYPATAVVWESSVNGGGTWTPITGASGNSYLAAGLTSATSYRATVNIATGMSCITPVSHIAVFNVVSPTTTGAERCGPGPLTLSASVAGAGVLKWYENPVGGPSVGTGTTFTTPSLTTTTDYYVTAGDGNSPDSVAVPLSSGTTTGVYHHMFLVSSTTGTTISDIALKINNAAGALTAWDIYYRPNNYQLVPGANTSNTGWTLLASTANVVSLGATNYTTIASNLSLAVPAGATYSLYIAPVTGTHQYASAAIGTVTATSTNMEIRAGNRGSSLFNCTTSGGQAVVKIKTVAGCESPRIPVTATINEVPAPNLGTDLDTCTFNAIPMTLDPGTQPAGSTYIWDDNTTGAQRDITTSGTYHVRVTTPEGCVNSDTIVILMREKPAIDLAANGTSFCNGATKILDAGPGGQNGGSYYWSNGAQTQTIEVANSGTYIVVVNSADGCFNTDTITVTTNGYAPTTDGIHVNALSVDSFTFSAINPQNITNYEWDFGDGSAISISANPTHKYHANGHYLVKMRIFSSCAGDYDSAYINIIGLGLKDAENLANTIQLYPNPNSNGILNITSDKQFSIINVSLINLIGQTIITEDKFIKGQKTHQLQLPGDIANGLYYLKIQTEKGTVSKQFEIRR